VRAATLIVGGFLVLVAAFYVCKGLGIAPSLFNERSELIGFGVIVVAAVLLGLRYGIQHKEWWY
jgi:hypothetical protein